LIDRKGLLLGDALISTHISVHKRGQQLRNSLKHDIAYRILRYTDLERSNVWN